MFIRKKVLLISIITVILISLFTFYESFSLALFGDDWLAFFRYREHVDPGFSKSWNYLTYFLTPYGPQDILMGVLQKIFHYQSTWYYLLSYIFRLIAAFSFYPLVLYLTKNRLASFFAVLFFSVTATGLDTTNWVFNMPSYITVALFNLFLYFFLKQREKDNLLLLIISSLLYYFAYITTPIRMHGSLLFIFLLEAFWIFQERNTKVLKKVVIRSTAILVIFLLIRYTGHSQGPLQETGERFFLGVKAMSEMLSISRFDFIFYPFIMFGGLIIPDFLLPIGQIISKSKLLIKIFIPAFLSFLIFAALLIRNLSVLQGKFIKVVTITAFCWMFVVLLAFHFNLATLNDGRFLFLLLIGGFSLIIIAFFFIKYFQQKNISTALFIGVAWSFLSFFFAWWWVPQSIFPTTYRYLIVSAAGVSIFLATIISLGKDKKKQMSILAILFLVLLAHIVSSRLYLNALLNSHGQSISDKIWNQIPYVAEIGKSRDPLIFYFEGDGTNGVILHDVITFGFPPHIALLYNLSEKDGGFPIPMSEFKDIVSAVVDGKVMKAYGYPEQPISLDRIYAFRLQGRDNLINVTNEAREKLKTFISARKNL